VSQRIRSTYSYVGWDTHQTIDPAREASCSFSSLVLGSQTSARSALAEVPRLVCIAAGSARYLHMARPKLRHKKSLESTRTTLMILSLIFDIFLLLSLIISAETQAARSRDRISSSLSESDDELLVEFFRVFFILKRTK
jgi:hypothetical protein